MTAEVPDVIAVVDRDGSAGRHTWVTLSTSERPGYPVVLYVATGFGGGVFVHLDPMELDALVAAGQAYGGGGAR